jgi:hypothetical protein
LNFENLRYFTGSENWYRHSLYWLLDEIALAQHYESAVHAETFQVWRLNVKGSAATLTCEDGNDHIVHTKAIPFTDFPGPGITLWCANNTILLPSEY